MVIGYSNGVKDTVRTISETPVITISTPSNPEDTGTTSYSQGQNERHKPMDGSTNGPVEIDPRAIDDGPNGRMNGWTVGHGHCHNE